ncbi:SDR family NAD(P)-dependent oxidoreductase [Tenacibaculum xiamenense]|uniref:SDR family NAD(P)-dependent oxidoreductase n=1 Tax=Tenacibaculum xiamenense TaxID=1261553 RepID=UPI00389478C1
MENNTNKRILITGANGAMAKETIKHLIKHGYNNIVMAVRTKHKGEIAKREILQSVKSDQTLRLVVIDGFDMNHPEKITAAVQKLDKTEPFDIVFLAAGFAVFSDNYESITYKNTQFEKTVFQNLIGSHIVYVQLKRIGLLSKTARIVLAGGEGARGISGMIKKPRFESKKSLMGYIHLKSESLPKYNPMNAIGVSKFVGGLWVKKLAEIEPDFEVVWFSPGLTSGSSGSSGLKNLPRVKQTVFNLMFGMMNFIGQSQSPQKGGEKYADCLMGNVGKSGELIGAPKGKTLGKYTEQTPLNTDLEKIELREALWDSLKIFDA